MVSRALAVVVLVFVVAGVAGAQEAGTLDVLGGVVRHWAHARPSSSLLTSVLGAAGVTTRVSVATGGGQADGGSVGPSISADGRYVAFISSASNLVPGDTNGRDDVFVHDRVTRQTTRVSVATSGGQGNGGCLGPSISADGRYVAFESWADNLVPEDTNWGADIFVHDRVTGQTTRVSVATGGGQADYQSGASSISGDGRYVAFDSGAENLVPGDTNEESDVFVHDRATGQTTRVSVATGGGQASEDSDGARISADGRYVAFCSFTSNLVPGDTNWAEDVFVHDRVTGQTTRVSVDTGGGESDHNSWAASISADGRYVVFNSLASNLAPGDTNDMGDVFVHDRVTGETTRVSVATGGGQASGVSGGASVSADGRYVAFGSRADNLVPGDTNDSDDVFVHDRLTGETTRVSVATGGGQASDDCSMGSISAGGRYVAFRSWADNLVPGDTNGYWDVFVHDRGAGAPKPGDINSDGVVDEADLNVFFLGWLQARQPQPTVDARCDLDGDGKITATDAKAFLEQWLSAQEGQ